MRYVLYFTVVMSLACSAALADSPVLRRVGRMPVWTSNIADAPAAAQAYYSLGCLGDGRVAASSIWEAPHLFKFHPESGSLENTAYVRAHQGNEDDDRWTLRYDISGPEPYIFWHLVNYEDLDGLSSNGNRDGGVFAGHVLPVNGVLPQGKFAYTNMPGYTGGLMGPGRRGIAYDQGDKLLFAVVNGRTTNPVDDDIFQVFRFNHSTGELEGRVQVWEPSTSITNYFIDVAPDHNLVMLGGGQHWTTTSGRLYIAEYTPTAGANSATVSNLQFRTNLQVVGTSGLTNRIQQPQCAVFAEGGNGRLYAIVGTGKFLRTVNPTEFSYGLYVFDLGPVGGPYTLNAPIARIPFDNAVEFAKIIGSQLIVSSFGLHIYDLSAVLAAQGVVDVPAVTKYPLPHRTYEFDNETISGTTYLFLASGTEGADIFSLGAGTNSVAAGDILPGIQRSVQTGGSDGRILLESDGQIKHIDRPVLNTPGQLAVWAVTTGNQEVILRREGTEWRVLAATGGAYVSLSSPSINNAGDVACFAGKADGTQVILLIQGGQVSEVVTSTGTYRRLGQPEIGNGPRMVFWAEPQTARQSVMAWHNGTESLIAREAQQVPYLLEWYDISPDGNTIVFVSAANETGGNRTTYLANNGTLAAMFPADSSVSRQQRYVRLAEGGVGSLTIWGSELVGFMTVKDGVREIVIRHRSSSYGLRVGYVGLGMANSRQESIFLAWDGFGTGPGLYFDDRSNKTRLFGVGNNFEGGVIRDIKFWDGFNDSVQVASTVAVRDGSGVVGQKLLLVPINGDPLPGEVAGQYVFYNNSSFDEYFAYADARDDNAIAIDKTALRPGETATFDNYTSFIHGINGIMVDLQNAPGTPTLADFEFRVGNNNNPSGWAVGPQPTMSMRAGAGVGGSRRITFIWPGGSITNTWLQVRVKATERTGLEQDEVFYFGNAIGESGNDSSSARVDTNDEIAARHDPHKSTMNPAGITNRHDFNRDGKVDTLDEIIARIYSTNFLTDLELISVP